MRNEDRQTQFQEILIISPRTGARGTQTGPVLLLRGGTAPEQLPSALQLSDVN